MSSLEVQTSVNSDQLVLALLEADAELGCCQEVFRAVRRSLSVRRAILEQLTQPEIRFHQTTIDYDDPAYRQLNPANFAEIDEAARPARLALSRSGRRTVTIAEISTGVSLSVACQRRLIELLGFRPTCFIEAGQALDRVLELTADLIMTFCGDPYELPSGQSAAPMVHRVSGRRLLKVNRLVDRYSQDYRLLAIQDC